MKNNKEKIKKTIYNFFKILIYIIILIILLYILINSTKSLKIINYEAFVIVSGSMEPEINNGDILIIKKVNENEIKKGDIITFDRNGVYITHRVVEIQEQENTKKFITKGDRNTVNDSDVVLFENIKGVKTARIPFIGMLIVKVSSSKYLIIILIMFALLYKRAKKIDARKKGRRIKKKIKNEEINNG